MLWKYASPPGAALSSGNIYYIRVVYCGKTIFNLIENYSVVIFFLWPAHNVSTSHKFYLCGKQHVHHFEVFTRRTRKNQIYCIVELKRKLFILCFYMFILPSLSQYVWYVIPFEFQFLHVIAKACIIYYMISFVFRKIRSQTQRFC